MTIGKCASKLDDKRNKALQMFAYPTAEIEFPVSPGYLSTLCEDIENDLQGKKLEYIACFLFLHIPGCTPAHNLLDQDRAMQTDVVIRNLTPHSNLAAETFGRYFVIECKNLAAKVVSAECGYFLHRIHLAHFTFGVMLAKEGVIGSPEKDKGDEESHATTHKALLSRRWLNLHSAKFASPPEIVGGKHNTSRNVI